MMRILGIDLVYIRLLYQGISTVLDVMAIKTSHLIKWPDRDTLYMTMPMSFRKFFQEMLCDN